MLWLKTSRALRSLLALALRSSHHRILSLGFLVVFLSYFATHLYQILLKSLHGQATILLLALLAFGIFLLIQQKPRLTRLIPSDEDRFIGYSLILAAAATLPFLLHSLWAKALLALLILAGAAIASWGLPVFTHHPLPLSLIALSLFPNPGVAVRTLWSTFVPHLLLEHLTAILGMWGLRLIGQPASLAGPHLTFIQLPHGAVEVAWGCTGFNMALAVAIMALLMGLFFHQSSKTIALLITLAILLSISLNIPRMVLLALAQIYWGPSHFDFWHDGWGAQLFSASLFSAFYYIAMPIIERSTEKKMKNNSDTESLATVSNEHLEDENVRLEVRK